MVKTDYTPIEYREMFAYVARTKGSNIADLVLQISRTEKMPKDTVDQLAYGKSNLSQQVETRVRRAVVRIAGGKLPKREIIAAKAKEYFAEVKRFDERVPYKTVNTLVDALIKARIVSSVNALANSIAGTTGYKNFADAYRAKKPIPRVAYKHAQSLAKVPRLDEKADEDAAPIVIQPQSPDGSMDIGKLTSRVYERLAPKLLQMFTEHQAKNSESMEERKKKGMEALAAIINRELAPLRGKLASFEVKIRSIENKFDPNAAPFPEGTSIVMKDPISKQDIVYQVKMGQWIPTNGPRAYQEIPETMKYELTAEQYRRMAEQELEKVNEKTKPRGKSAPAQQQSQSPEAQAT